MVTISNDKAKELIRERINYFGSQDVNLLEMLEEYLCEMVDEGVFDGGEFDEMDIVDNAIINDFGVNYTDNDKVELIDLRIDEVIMTKEL